MIEFQFKRIDFLFYEKIVMSAFITDREINTRVRRDYMAKKGMRRPDPSEPHGTESNHSQHFQKNDVRPVPEIQGKAKTGNKKAGPI